MQDHRTAPAPLWTMLAITFLGSLSSGVMWNGIAFVAKRDFRFDERASFLLLLVAGCIYVAVAFGAGRASRSVERFLSPRGLLAAVFLAQAVACLSLLLPNAPWTLWTATAVGSAAAALQWPLVESYVTAGRHGPRMRSALGWWNVTWTVAVPVALVLMAPLIANDLARLAIVALTPTNLLCAGLLRWVPKRPGHHDAAEAEAAVTREYVALLASVRVLLPSGYLLVGALSPLMPYLLADLAVAASLETPITSTWTVARVAALVVMWRSRFWHGRWGTLLLGGLLVFLGFATVVLAPNLLLLLGGLAAFGAGLGVVYYAAIYYAMAVGHAEVDAAGTHEGLIGVGYAVGPATGLLAYSLAEGRAAALTMVVLIGAMVALAAAAAFRPYLASRMARRAALGGSQPGAGQA